MAYQNNNNRVVPNETIDVKLNPVASPTNQEVKYQPDLTDAKRTAATADALAKLGQGIMDMDYVWNRQAQDSIIAAELETEAQGGNKKDWADVSKNVRGMAKYNPHIKDAFKSFTAKEVCSMGALKIASNTNILNGKMSSGEKNKFYTETTKEVLSELKNLNLSPHDYGDYLESYYNQIQTVDKIYTQKNNEYTYNNSLTAMAHDGSMSMFDSLSYKGDKITNLRTSVTNVIANAEKLGIPADDIASKVIVNMASEFMMNNPDKVNTEDMTKTLANIKIYGKDLNEIIPNASYQIHQVLVQAQNAQLQDREFELKSKKLELELNTMELNKEAYNFYTKNPNANAQAWADFYNKAITKYGVEAVGLEITKGGYADVHAITSYQSNISNPRVLHHLQALGAVGELSGEEVTQAINSNQLGFNDGMQLMGIVNRESKAEAVELHKQYTGFNSMLKQPQFKTMNKSVTENLQTRADTIINDKTKTVAEKQAALQALTQRALNIQKINKGKVSYNLLLNTTYQQSLKAPKSDRKQAEKAFHDLAFVRNGNGTASSRITSMPTDTRVRTSATTGKAYNGEHGGYDVTGKAAYNTHADGVVVATGYMSGYYNSSHRWINNLGNYIIIQYANGNMVRMGHLATSTKHLQGKKILKNQYIGEVGHTGLQSSAGNHVDFRLMNSSGAYINAEQFRRGLF